MPSRMPTVINTFLSVFFFYKEDSVRGSFQPVSDQTCTGSMIDWLPEGAIQHFYELDLHLNNSHGYNSVVAQPDFLSDVLGGS